MLEHRVGADSGGELLYVGDVPITLVGHYGGGAELARKLLLGLHRDVTGATGWNDRGTSSRSQALGAPPLSPGIKVCRDVPSVLLADAHIGHHGRPTDALRIADPLNSSREICWTPGARRAAAHPV
jgi:hypothetical protein